MGRKELDFEKTIEVERERFILFYQWLKQAMPAEFFEEIDSGNIVLIVHNLMGLHLQNYYSSIHLKGVAIDLCLDSTDADLRILQNYAFYGIKNYQTYVSHKPLPGSDSKLRIATLYFTEASEQATMPYPEEKRGKVRALAKKHTPAMDDNEFDSLIAGINSHFLRPLTPERLALAIDMFFRAKTRDNCQYEVRYNEDWKKRGAPSMEIVLAWRNCPKHNFLYRLARTVYRHGLVMRRVSATYIDSYRTHNILILVLGLDGSSDNAPWDVADIPDFLRELVTVKYFASFDSIDKALVSSGVISGTMGNFLRAMVNFVHQALVHIDPNLYTIANIEEALCRHPKLAAQLCAAFKYKFDPHHHHYKTYLRIRDHFFDDVEKLDTGQELNDIRRKNVLHQGMDFIHYTLKTNFYRLNSTAFSFRLDPRYLDEIPFDRKKKFPTLPYAIYFIKGMHFFGFHIRFKDLARGGLRTVIPRQSEHVEHERNTIFTECYNLAYTQQKKNKDIPEGGSKGVLLVLPHTRIESEAHILKKELRGAGLKEEEVEQRIATFENEQKAEYLYQAQRSYIESLVTIVNCNADGTLRAKYIIDYWKRPEYLYLGPDEGMHDSMIKWIAHFSRKYDYKPGGTFISGKPNIGINHKSYGVTSLGVNVYMDKLLRHLGIDPEKTPFTIKISGGPDGDVAGNAICNLYRYYRDTAKLVALTDISGTIFDPAGLKLELLVQLFEEGRPIKYYPPAALHDGSFLLDKQVKRSRSAFAQQTLCWRMTDGTLVEEWLSGSEMNHLLRHNVHQTDADIFIPAGGRPRTLNAANVTDFLDQEGVPTARAIVEGANLYLTPEARTFLEERGCLIIKDSSANKTGVICSSFEVQCGLTLSDTDFLGQKEQLVAEILERLRRCAAAEADLLIRTHNEKGVPLTAISEAISERINKFTYELLDHLDALTLPGEATAPLNSCFLNYCLPTLRRHYPHALIDEIPDLHKKAIIACHIAADLVYTRGLDWYPSIVDILPLLLDDASAESQKEKKLQ